MTTLGNNITKLSQVNDFIAGVYNNVKNNIQWYYGSIDTDQDELGFPLGYLDTEGNDPGKPDASELTDPVIIASILAGSFQDWVKTYTKVRKLRFRRVRQQSGNNYPEGDVVQFDETEIANIIPGALSPAPDSGGPDGLQPGEYAAIEATAGEQDTEAADQIYATTFNNYIAALYDKWLNAKDNIVTYTYTYCHDSCHISCHLSCHTSGRHRR